MENQHTKQSFAMKGGEGPHSYVQNSSNQRKIIEAAQKLIQESVNDELDPTSFSVPTDHVRIADLGCSTGPNTLFAMQTIIEAIQRKYQSSGLDNQIPEFQVFFNDQVSNDFNTLFKTLPPTRNYHAAAVPGSFHGRLFPKKSIHFFHSSSTLHWLSKIPNEITDKESPAWNKGKILYGTSAKEVVNAYANQHKEDMKNFLNARAQELVADGLMALQLFGIPDVILEPCINPAEGSEVLGSCLLDMAKEGLIKEEDVDSFNLPIYYSPIKDLKAIFEENEDFSIERVEEMNLENSFNIANVEMYVSIIRSIMEGLLEKHFGGGIMDELFNRFGKKALEFPVFMNPQLAKVITLFVLLKRKPHA